MPSIDGSAVRKLVIACDAGMASSVLMSTQLRKHLAPRVLVTHSPVDALPADADVVLTHDKLAARARLAAGDRPVVAYDKLIGDPAVADLVRAIREGELIQA
ncbi:PTS lactose transporter subunit IIB [Modestobacter sp. Leaf380]|uniref:PTS lactose transporter subunit IIB n=1 Tax=Modestobacter sp. Leaf380 TaxID=1736356 RepID=UPI0006F9580B|nr:PTS lactose transporter subunit IIB [Modestobacter sp. Leaf380]KQS66735.1 PTS lactose transporter subunit IIB [Modestobacter sp. Leaf380]